MGRTHFLLLSLILILLITLSVSEADADHRVHRLAYNNPGLVTDLGVGLWAIPLPMDWDGDGDNDLLASTADTPYKGLYFFENDGSGVFQPGKPIATGKQNITVSYVDGDVIVCEPGLAYKDFKQNLYANPSPIAYKKEFYAGRANQWKFADFDGDGVHDLLIGISDWRDYGWDDAYDSSGNWTAGPLHGYVYWVKNLGTNKAPKYGKAQQIQAGGKPLDVYGAPSPNLVDWDGDGDMDLICGEFLDRISFFENTGTRKNPTYAAGRYLEVGGETLHLELEMLQVVVIDWDKDGDPDIIVGKEDGRVVLVENAGKGKDGLPKLKPPVYFKQRADKVKCGALVTPCSYDWDGDGDEDLICGNTAGFIEFIENLDGKNPPKWAAPRRLTADGKVIRYMADPNLSIQGPAEVKWGYTVPYVADWDMDGLPDIVVNTIIGKIEWLRNIGTKKTPRLAPAQPLEVEWEGPPPKPAWNWWNPGPKELVVEWRTKPVVIDLNKDGLNDLVAIDHEGFLAFFERRKVDGKLQLLPGKRIFRDEDHSRVFDAKNNALVVDLNGDGVNDLTLRDQDGSPIFYTRAKKIRSGRKTFDTNEKASHLVSAGKDSGLLRMNCGWAGPSGRRKLTMVDWDQDGRLDLLVNSRSIDLLHNIGTEGSYVFRNRGPVVDDKLAGHTTCPTFVDWDKDGVHDLLIGAEDGFLYYYPRKASQELLGGK